MAKITLSLLILSVILAACPISAGWQETLIPVTPTIQSGAWYSVYFTDPTNPFASTYRGGPDEKVAAAIDQAQTSVDAAIYDLNLWSIRDALIGAHRRGVTVRMVTDSDNMDEQEVQDLKDAGIKVLGDRREALMHDKFIVIDRLEVWTGSMNFTTGGGYLDNNNLIRIRSSRMAEDYTHEFEQMFVEDHFGANKSSSTPYPTVTIDGTLVEVYFSPQDGTLEHLLSVVNSAQESIYFLSYSFTSNELADAMIARAKAGASVKGVFDKDQYHSNEGTEYDRLLSAGIDVRLDGNTNLMHHKVIIIDKKIVITGSYNFSNNAERRNDENSLIIHNTTIATDYINEFQKIFDLAQR